jgi:hypothetical protein
MSQVSQYMMGFFGSVAALLHTLHRKSSSESQTVARIPLALTCEPEEIKTCTRVDPAAEATHLSEILLFERVDELLQRVLVEHGLVLHLRVQRQPERLVVAVEIVLDRLFQRSERLLCGRNCVRADQSGEEKF